MPLTFSAAAKNYILDGLVKTTTMQYAQINQLKVFNAGSVALAAALSVAWGTPVQGTAALATGSITPTSTDTCTKMEWWNSSAAVIVASGSATISGGGGNLILGTAAFASGTPVSLASILKVPLNNGGTLRLNQALANAIANCITNGVASPQLASGGTIYFYDGAQPATADTALSGNNLLGTLTLATTDYGSAAGGASALAASKAVTPSASGSVTWCRWVKGGYILDASAGTAGTDFIVDSATWASGVGRSLTAATLTLP